jgi:hypothetical protein
LDILGYTGPPRYLGPSPLHFTPSRLRLLRPAHLMFHPLCNPILLCISRRAIFRSICTHHLPLAHGPAAIARHPSHICTIARAPLVPPHQPRCLCGGRRRLTRIAHEYCYHYLFHYSRNPRTPPGIRNSFAPLTFHIPPPPHDRQLAPVRPHPIWLHSSRTTGTTLASIRLSFIPAIP